MTIICGLLIVAFVAREYFAAKEREKLVRRIQSPQSVIVEEAPKHPSAIAVRTDAQYRKLMESRGQIPRDN